MTSGQRRFTTRPARLADNLGDALKEGNMRQEFEMTEEDLKELMDACKPVAYMIFGGMGPVSPHENANQAWCRLGEKMGFDGMTVEPASGGVRFFTAEATENTVGA